MDTVTVFFQQANFFDLLCGVVILLFGIWGFFRGFIETVLGFIALFGSLLLSWLFYRPLGASLIGVGVDEKVSYVLAFIIIFIASFLVIKIIEHFLKLIKNISLFNSLDRILGILAGGLNGFLVVVVAIVILGGFLGLFFDVKGVLTDSVFFQLSEVVFKFVFNDGAIISV